MFRQLFPGRLTTEAGARATSILSTSSRLHVHLFRFANGHASAIGDHALVQMAHSRGTSGHKNKGKYGVQETGNSSGNHAYRKFARRAEMLTVGLPDRSRVLGERPSLHENIPSTSKVGER
jgi:hypothetical protein